MNLSTQSLFHYTKSVDNIIGIIEQGFKHSSNPESLPLRGFNQSPFSLPGAIDYKFRWDVVCFCDIPLRDIKEHISQYGLYCIGLKKEWAISNGITPIRYIHDFTPDLHDDTFMTALATKWNWNRYGSSMVNIVINMLTESGSIDGVKQEEYDALPEKFKLVLHLLDEEIQRLYQHIYNAGGFLRAYKGDWDDRTTGEMKERIFYEEREWRSLKIRPDQSNLMFELSDITHIFVQTNEERERIFQTIMNQADKLKVENENEARYKLFFVF